MKQLFLMAGVLALLTSCTKVVPDAPAAPEGQPSELKVDLASLSYESLMTALSECTSLDGVTFTDGELTRTVTLTASDELDPDQADALVFKSAPSDSLDVTVTPDYAAVRITSGGEQLAWLAYGDGVMQEAVAERYASIAPATKSGAPAVTRSAAGAALKLNLSVIAEGMEARASASGSYALPEVELPAAGGVATKGWFSNLFKKIVTVFKPAPAPAPRTPTIDLYLMRERGGNPLTHEINWQANDAISALKDVQGNIKVNVRIVDCDFQGTNDSDKDLSNFTNWVKNSSYRNTNGVFFLCRWGGWNNTLGRAYVGDYDVNNDLKGYGISCTNAWNKHTLAHEVGHIFGAGHVSVAWWQIFSADLMASSSHDWLSSGKHKDNGNRNRIKARLTYR